MLLASTQGSSQFHPSVLCQHNKQLLSNITGLTGKVLSYSLPSVGPGADPGVQTACRRLLIHSPAVGCHTFLPDMRSQQRHTGVNNLTKVVTQICLGMNQTHNLLIASPMPYRYATAPPYNRDVFVKFYEGAWSKHRVHCEGSL